MQMIRIFNYDDKIEHIAASAIESVVLPGGGPNDNGVVVLRSGRRVSLGRSMGQAEQIIKALEAEVEGG